MRAVFKLVLVLVMYYAVVFDLSLMRETAGWMPPWDVITLGACLFVALVFSKTICAIVDGTYRGALLGTLISLREIVGPHRAFTFFLLFGVKKPTDQTMVNLLYSKKGLVYKKTARRARWVSTSAYSRDKAKETLHLSPWQYLNYHVNNWLVEAERKAYYYYRDTAVSVEVTKGEATWEKAEIALPRPWGKTLGYEELLNWVGW